MLLQRLQAQPDAYTLHHVLLDLAPEAVLVGGAVRDLLLQRPFHDLDYVLPGEALPVARRLADRLGLAYYPLDEVRGTGRVVWKRPDQKELILDLASLRAQTLAADLWARDFTINAIALRPDGELIDPSGGAADLEGQRLRPCLPTSLQADPVRALRAVRFLFTFELQPDPALAGQIRLALPGLRQVSVERQREELLEILALPEPHFAFMQMRAWGLESELFPAMVALHGVAQSAPHVFDVYEHTLAALRAMARLDRLLRQQLPARAALDEELLSGLAPYAADLRTYLAHEFAGETSRWLWLRFAALAHDWGKPANRTVAGDGRIHFYGHEETSAHLVEAWLQRYHAPAQAINFVRDLCLGHMRPHHLRQASPPSRRAIYRFYRDLGDAAWGVLLLNIADFLATGGPQLETAQLRDHLAFLAELWQPALAGSSRAILPQPLLDGHDVMLLLGLPPGPRIGQLLEALREAQAVGEVENRAQAQAFINKVQGRSGP